MQSLNFPTYNFRFKSSENKIAIFDPVRKKFIQLTPEEWVRQHVIQYLMTEKKIPKSLLSVEKEIAVHQTKKRYDIVVFNKNGSLFLVVECKAPTVLVTQKTFDQIARYNRSLNATYLMITNGLNHYFCQIDPIQEKYQFLKDLPNYDKIN